jgi:hypothetical protein
VVDQAPKPTIAPDLAYGDLDEVSDGRAAQLAYLEMVHADTADERQMQLAESLRVYCCETHWAWFASRSIPKGGV